MRQLGKQRAWATLAVAATLMALALGACDDGSVNPEALDGASNGIRHFSTGTLPTVAIGQPDLTTSGFSLSASGLDFPAGKVAGSGSLFYVADYNAHRVLGYTAIPSISGASANFVLGQTNFTSGSSGTSAIALTNPSGVAVSGSKLALADTGNHRVLIWNALPTTNAAPASVVVGQSTMTGTGGSCNQFGLSYPQDVEIAGGRLIVADSNNNRVLIWNTIPTSDGTAADLVIGQLTFSSCNINIVGSTTPTADSLRGPAGVWSDGVRLLVGDGGNSRVLIWNTFPTANSQPADMVAGQADLVTGTLTGGPTGVGTPAGILYTGSQLLVTDQSDNRVLVYNSLPASAGATADGVLGQPDAFGNASNNPNPAQGMHQPSGVFLLQSRLFVSDSVNNRILVYP